MTDQAIRAAARKLAEFIWREGDGTLIQAWQLIADRMAALEAAINHSLTPAPHTDSINSSE